MDMSRLSFAFQQNNIFAVRSPFHKLPGQQQNSVTDVLNRISSNIIGAQEQRKSMEATVKTQEAEIDAYTSEIDAAQQKSLEEMPDGMLHFLRNQFLVRRNISCKMEQELTAFRDQLSGIDQTIQEYQSILDGKAAVPDDLTLEDVTALLETTMATREQFVQDNAERLNKWNMDEAVRDTRISRSLERVVGENKFSGADASTWEIDASASDIYAEIDRVLSATRSVTETMEEGYRRICNELEKRGYTEWKYEEHLSAMREQTSIPVMKSGTSLQFIMDALEKAMEQKREESDQ